jgi:hypothetical protein
VGEISEAVKQAIIHLAGSGTSLDRIVELLKSKGVDVGIDEVARVILESGKGVEEEYLDVEDVVGVLKWLIKKQISRVNKLFAVESMSPIPLSETTNNLKILADLVIKYSEITKRGISVSDLKAEILGLKR